MPKDFIVAIELGSSKITGIAGQKNLDGSITVLALVEEDSSTCIRKGVIYNIDKTCICLTNIVKKLKTALHQNISQVYVGVGGRSIRSVKNTIAKDLPQGTVISQEMVNQLMDTNRNMIYPDQQILDAVTQEFKIDSQYQIDPVGIQCSHLEGIFLNILGRKNFYNNITTCFENAKIFIADMYLAPLALADSILTDAEKRTGCMLVDLGADTTTVSVYYKNILRHLSVIPLGGNNITKDLTSLQIEEHEAEKLKVKYAKAYTENSKIDPTLSYSVDAERSVESRKLIELVEARVEEIVENAWYQVPTEYADKILGGIILTGGGSNLANIDKVFKLHTHIDKVRIAKFVTHTINSNDTKITCHDGSMNTILGLLAKGDMSCSGKELEDNLFGAGEDGDKSQTTEVPHKPTRDINQIAGKGVVLSEEEKKKAEEEARRKREEEEAEKQRLIEEEKQRIAKEKRENSPLHKLWRWGKGFAQSVTSAEDE